MVMDSKDQGYGTRVLFKTFRRKGNQENFRGLKIVTSG